MGGKYLLDTNVFVNAFDRNSTHKANRALQLIENALVKGRGVISYQVIQEARSNRLAISFIPKIFSTGKRYKALRSLIRSNSDFGLAGRNYAHAM
jgi:predicted nucleic acid-binding protein